MIAITFTMVWGHLLLVGRHIFTVQGNTQQMTQFKQLIIAQDCLRASLHQVSCVMYMWEFKIFVLELSLIFTYLFIYLTLLGQNWV
jgi:hypothetical protein